MQYTDFDQRIEHLKIPELKKENEILRAENHNLKLVVRPLNEQIFQKESRIEVLEIQNQKLHEEIEELKARMRNTMLEPDYSYS